MVAASRRAARGRNRSLTEQVHMSTHRDLSEPPRAITIAILAMGGEGGGVLADWIVDAAEHAGYIGQTTSVPGVAQRTGSTIYYIELFPESAVQAAGKDPVLALMPVPGEVDIVLASELMEAGRAVQRGLVTPERTLLITSTNRVYSMTEKTAAADARVDAASLLVACRAAARKFVSHDFARLAEEKRSAISAVLLGALAGASALPFTGRDFQEAIRRSGVGVESSLAAFNAGFAATREKEAEPGTYAENELPKIGHRLQALVTEMEAAFPRASHDILVPALQRLSDYQDLAYASEYLERLRRIRDLELQCGRADAPLLRETARHLALWMTYEDAARVADLKTRHSRFDRVRRESRADSSQLVQISEFLYPRKEEMADMMPARLGHWFLTSRTAHKLAERLTRHGRTIQTTSITGFLQLYLIAELRRWRRRSYRFQEESRRIEDWLSSLREFAGSDYASALEIAELPRLVKGYGDTHVIGRRKFDLLMNALPILKGREDLASTLKKLHEIALADESGDKLEQALHEVLAAPDPLLFAGSAARPIAHLRT